MFGLSRPVKYAPPTVVENHDVTQASQTSKVPGALDISSCCPVWCVGLLWHALRLYFDEISAQHPAALVSTISLGSGSVRLGH